MTDHAPAAADPAPHRFAPGAVLAGVWRRFSQEKGLIVAASLAFTTMLSLVPMATVAFGLFAAFPAVSALLDQARDWAIDAFVPGVSVEIERQVAGFIANAASLPVLGIILLLGSALLLLIEIEHAFNGLWRVRARHGWGVRLLGFWAILTAFPLIAAASVYGFVETIGGADPTTRGLLAPALPLIIGWVACFGMYVAFPARTIAKGPAAIGAFVAALLLTIAKAVFTAYLETTPMQYAIYGALAALPLLQVWLYVCWVLILLGAALAAELEARQDLPAEGAVSPESSDTGAADRA